MVSSTFSADGNVVDVLVSKSDLSGLVVDVFKCTGRQAIPTDVDGHIGVMTTSTIVEVNEFQGTRMVTVTSQESASEPVVLPVIRDILFASSAGLVSYLPDGTKTVIDSDVLATCIALDPQGNLYANNVAGGLFRWDTIGVKTTIDATAKLNGFVIDSVGNVYGYFNPSSGPDAAFAGLYRWDTSGVKKTITSTPVNWAIIDPMDRVVYVDTLQMARWDTTIGDSSTGVVIESGFRSGNAVFDSLGNMYASNTQDGGVFRWDTGGVKTTVDAGITLLYVSIDSRDNVYGSGADSGVAYRLYRFDKAGLMSVMDSSAMCYIITEDSIGNVYGCDINSGKGVIRWDTKLVETTVDPALAFYADVDKLDNVYVCGVGAGLMRWDSSGLKTVLDSSATPNMPDSGLPKYMLVRYQDE